MVNYKTEKTEEGSVFHNVRFAVANNEYNKNIVKGDYVLVEADDMDVNLYETQDGQVNYSLNLRRVHTFNLLRKKDVQQVASQPKTVVAAPKQGASKIAPRVAKPATIKQQAQQADEYLDYVNDEDLPF